MARWDLFIPSLVVVVYSAIIWGLGYYEGRKRAEDKALLVADIGRMKVVQDKQLYDWERDGI